MTRARRLALGVVSGVFTKGTAFIFTLISVPLTLHYLGAERYGIWVTMISVLAWLSMIDLGLANGLTPLLSISFAKGRMDLARGYIATAFWALTSIAAIVGTVTAIFWQWIDWSRVFKIVNNDLDSEISTAMILAIAIFLLSLPLTITQRIYLANQKGLHANIWQFFASFAGVVGIYFATKTQGGLVYLVIGYSGAQLLIGILNSVWLFGWSQPKLRPFVFPNISDSKQVMTMGGMFFVNQIATLIVFQKDNILISNILGPVQAASYSVAWQLFFYLNAINILVAPYLGPAFAEAYAKNDVRWMRLVVYRYLLITSSVALPSVIVLTLFYRSILEMWVGSDVMPETETVYWIAIWTFVMSIQWPIITLLNSTGRLKVFSIVYFFAAIVNLFLSVVLIKMLGVSGGVIATVITVVSIVLFPSTYQLLKIIKGNRVERLLSKF